MIKLKNYWAGLTERERWTLAASVVVSILYLFYLLIYAPLTSKINQNAQQLEEKTATLAWMESIQKSAARLAPKSLSNSKLLALLSTELNQNSFKRFPGELEQTGVNEIKLTFSQVPYNIFINWLKVFTKTYAVSINQLNIERTNGAGLTKVTVLFRNA